MSQLPRERHIDKAKVVNYLLDPVNSRGKALFFERMGFNLLHWEQLRNALFEHATSGLLALVVASPYGTRYIVAGTLNTPSRREPAPIVTVVWQQDTGSGAVRLITAYAG